jgi:hypothetical protein
MAAVDAADVVDAFDVFDAQPACLSMLRPYGRPDKSGPMALNQFRPSVPVWSETLWPTFVTHVAIFT